MTVMPAQKDENGKAQKCRSCRRFTQHWYYATNQMEWWCTFYGCVIGWNEDANCAIYEFGPYGLLHKPLHLHK